MNARSLLALSLASALALAALPAGAQSLFLDTDAPPEGATPPPPAYSTHDLIEVEMPAGISVRIGVDPASIRLDREAGVVRYVAVARGASSVNATYEGVRCSTGEFRVYARQVQGGEWLPSGESAWRPIRGQSSVMVRHPGWLASNGLCMGTTLPGDEGQIVRDLKSGHASLYR